MTYMPEEVKDDPIGAFETSGGCTPGNRDLGKAESYPPWSGMPTYIGSTTRSPSLSRTLGATSGRMDGSAPQERSQTRELYRVIKAP